MKYLDSDGIYIYSNSMHNGNYVMSKLPQVSGQQTIKALKRIGFQITGQRGSHIRVTRIINGSKQSITIPNHKIIKKGTLRNGI